MPWWYTCRNSGCRMSACSKYNHFIVGGSVLCSVHCLNEKYTWFFKSWTCLSHQEHRKSLAVFTGHWINQSINQSASVIFETLVGDVGSTFNSQFYCCDPPGWQSATEHSSSAEVNSHLSPHFVALEISLMGLQKPTTGHSLVPDKFILHPFTFIWPCIISVFF
jgi:hypothetical protein